MPKYDANEIEKAGSRRIIFVEGPDDELFYSSVFDRVFGENWPSAYYLIHAGGKANVIKHTSRHTDALGVVDRDELSIDEIASYSTARIAVLPRFCVENYFVDPNDIWNSLPNNIQSKGDQVQMFFGFDTALSAWVRHGVLWTVINPLWSGIKALGFKDALIQDVNAIQDDAAIEAKLSEWWSFLNPEPIMMEFKKRLANAAVASTTEQYQLHIHGKKYFEQVIAPFLNKKFGQKSESDWKKELLKSFEPPEDIKALVKSWTN